MAVTPYQEKKYVQSDAVTQAQQALQNQQANKPGAYQSQFQTGMNDLMGWSCLSGDPSRCDLDARAQMYNELTEETLLNAA